MSELCDQCAPLVYDDHPVTFEDALNAAEECIDSAVGLLEDRLGETATFALLNDWLWQRRPHGRLEPRRKPVSAALRASVLERDEHACVECAATDELQIDHIIPVAKGGPTDEDNLRTLCGDCNRSKRDA